jgi:hypothetical protein
MKKRFVSEIFIFASVAVLLVGCVPSAQPTAIPLELNDQKISLEFLQGEANVLVSSHNHQLKVVLKPEPFTLKVNGDKKIASILALPSADLVSPLQQSSKPLVAPLYTGYAFSDNDLYLSDLPLETYDVNMYTLQYLSFFAFPAEKAINTANTLKNQFGSEPLMLVSGRAYINTQLDQDQNYSIRTINKNTIQSGESIVLLVFVEKPSNDSYFRALKWLMFNLEFQ